MRFRAKIFTEAFDVDIENQDSAFFCQLNSTQFLAAVADGVGGHLGGNHASHIAIEVVRATLMDKPQTSFSDLYAMICQRIKEKSFENPQYTDMATTLSIVILDGATVRYAHVGDSRIYHLRNSGIKQVTEDQSEVALLMRQGILNQRNAKTYRRRSVLYSALSGTHDFELIQGEFEAEEGDRILLLTDGVYRLLTKLDIRDISVRSKSVDDLIVSIATEIQLIGKKDDATVVAIDFLPNQIGENIVQRISG